MKHLRHTIKAVITEGDESGCMGTCFGLPIITRSVTLDEEVEALQKWDMLKIHC
jgi:glutamine amidotransferase PdxT